MHWGKWIWVSFLWVPDLWAHFGERYGFGIESVSQLRSNSTRCDSNSHAAYYNPALLGCTGEWKLEVGYVFSKEIFKPIEGVLQSSTSFPANPDPVSVPSGSFSTDTPDQNALQVGAHIPLRSLGEWFSEHHATVGLSLHLNMRHFMSFQAGHGFEPGYTQFGHRDQHFFSTLSAGVEVIHDRLWVGLGSQLFITSGVSATMIYEQTNPSGQTATDVDTQIALLSGVRGKPFANWPLYLSLVYHQSMDQKINASARTDIPISGGSGQPFHVTAQASVYSEPHRLRIGASWEKPKYSIEFVVMGAFWKWAKHSKTELEFTTPSKQSIPMTNRYRNIASFSLGGTYRFPKFSILSGLGYEPSMVKTMTEAENEIDSDKLSLGLGVLTPFPWLKKINVGLSYQLLVMLPQTVTKSSVNYLGAPSYAVGGSVHTVSLGVFYGF